MKERYNKFRVTAFIFWMISVYAVFFLVYCLLFNNTTTIMHILFVFAVACFIYVDFALIMEYRKVNNVLSQIKRVESKYKYFQTYVDENNLIIEILKEEVEKLRKDLMWLEIKSKKIEQDEKLVKYMVDLKQ